jgi:hypothetical protein
MAITISSVLKSRELLSLLGILINFDRAEVVTALAISESSSETVVLES